jgi:hypothetical protein
MEGTVVPLAVCVDMVDFADGTCLRHAHTFQAAVPLVLRITSSERVPLKCWCACNPFAPHYVILLEALKPANCSG